MQNQQSNLSTVDANIQSYLKCTDRHATCINNSNSMNLTIGKTYPILTEDDNKVSIIDDSNRMKYYYASRFEVKTIKPF